MCPISNPRPWNLVPKLRRPRRHLRRSSIELRDAGNGKHDASQRCGVGWEQWPGAVVAKSKALFMKGFPAGVQSPGSRLNAQKKDAEPRPLREPRPRGTKEQPWPAPLRARLKVLLLWLRAESPGWSFREKQFLDARASFKLSKCGRPRPLGFLKILSNACPAKCGWRQLY